MSTGNTAFVLISAAMVLFMTPGLGFFYGGLGRRKNAVSNIMNSFFIMGTAMVMWVICGYSLSFGTSNGGFIGDLSYAFFNNIGMGTGPYSDSIPAMAFAVFQMMFAVITPALITGSLAGRMKFRSLFMFIVLWSLIVYYPIAHMMWAKNGFMASLGAVDFAGGNVVHISSGVSALILCILLGKRHGYDHANYRVHNIPLVAIGAALLLFGWFGFNSGSALAANGLAAVAFADTAVSAAAGMLSWMLIDVISSGKPTLVGACTGLVVGLVAITPGCGYVPVWAALVIGLLVSPICYFAVSVIKKKFGYDDALDAFGCHGIGGIWGGIATGLFARQDINPDVLSCSGLVYGDTHLFFAQLLSIIITIGIAAAGTFICAGIVRAFGPIRADIREEQIGMDISQHGEHAYPSFNGFD